MPTKTLITLQADLARLEEQREEIAQTLSELNAEIRAMKTRLRAGDVDKPGEVRQLLSDLRHWLRAANETEMKLDELRRRDAAIHGAYGLDLEQAAADIGCRLHRIRACCGAEPVSE